MQEEIKSNIKKNWVYIFLTNPQLYFLKLFYRTLIMGGVTLVISFLYYQSRWKGFVLPVSMHSVFGMAIGFLIVFRANTSYERWTEGRKSIGNMFNAIRYICVKLDSRCKEDAKFVKKLLLQYFDHFIIFLKSKDMRKNHDMRIKEDKAIKSIMYHIRKLRDEEKIEDRDLNQIETHLAELMKSCGDCERIKSTPIPLSYSLHIKVSVFIYLVTLPFGILAEYHLWATVFVMIIYYIIAGIEIISNEIENPFHGDPNDLPLDEYRKQMKEILK